MTYVAAHEQSVKFHSLGLSLFGVTQSHLCEQLYPEGICQKNEWQLR